MLEETLCRPIPTRTSQRSLVRRCTSHEYSELSASSGTPLSVNTEHLAWVTHAAYCSSNKLGVYATTHYLRSSTIRGIAAFTES